MRNSTVDNLSLVLQALSLEILFKDYNNGDLMQELQTQDEKYLKKIIQQNEEIINILNERREPNAREARKEDRRKYQ
jgi:hypothetical protein